ncbi:hypothetical protein [Thiomicrorhabdus sp. 6S3-12]|uniref:hypothetical protein n=1 Tax=Thiomicrorhabdus sp. 6S3-12 TaxID=2819681 RepID=UPI001AAD5F9C|nr:hypothetical protein [Thiomicrorhabdus sp. 6S3-12]MBO1923433.1 hypothetical protein [Thiomicrorhabdus sp. 6S3-12]
MTSKTSFRNPLLIITRIVLWIAGAAYYFLASVGLGMAFSLQDFQYDTHFLTVASIGTASLITMGTAAYFSKDYFSQLISFGLAATFLFYGIYNALELIEENNTAFSVWLVSVGSLFIPPLLWMIWPFKHLKKIYFANKATRLLHKTKTHFNKRKS